MRAKRESLTSFLVLREVSFFTNLLTMEIVLIDDLLIEKRKKREEESDWNADSIPLEARARIIVLYLVYYNIKNIGYLWWMEEKRNFYRIWVICIPSNRILNRRNLKHWIEIREVLTVFRFRERREVLWIRNYAATKKDRRSKRIHCWIKWLTCHLFTH